jgi:hypothetical protein
VDTPQKINWNLIKERWKFNIKEPILVNKDGMIDVPPHGFRKSNWERSQIMQIEF